MKLSKLPKVRQLVVEDCLGPEDNALGQAAKGGRVTRWHSPLGAGRGDREVVLAAQQVPQNFRES